MKNTSIQRMHALYALFSTLLVCVLCFCLGFYAYILERTRLLQESRQPYLNVSRAYAEKNDNFWKLYVPIVSNKTLKDSFARFVEESADSLGFYTRKNLCAALEQMRLADSEIIGFILHVNTDGATDYIYDVNAKSLQPLDEDSPFREYFAEMDENSRVITGCHTLTCTDNSTISVYGIGGGFPDMTPCNAALLVLYRMDGLISAEKEYSGSVASDVLLMTASGRVIFDSDHQYENHAILPEEILTQNRVALDGSTYYVDTSVGARGRYISVCLTPRATVIRLANKNTPLFLLLCLLINAINVFFHLYTGHLNAERARELIHGIERLGQHELTFRFPVKNNHDEYDRIAKCINEMAEAMQCNIEQVFIHSLREKEAEMGELQAKFNPHFLYNTLEVIRTHLQQKGDDDTAGMIVLLARIFRSAIDSNHFTTLRKEFLFINGYLDIYRWRYENSFDVIYDVDTKLLEFGIIRNLLQPVIENYFVHGFSPDLEHNELIISGESDGNEHIILTVEDNGLGMDSERLSALQATLQSCNREVKTSSSYGLQNLNDRIRLFYGSDCGLTVSSEPRVKTIIRIRIRRMSLAEHETWIRRS